MEVGSVGVVGVAGGVVGGLTNGGCPANSSAISAISSLPVLSICGVALDMPISGEGISSGRMILLGIRYFIL